MSGFGAKEARYNTRLAKQDSPRINLCGYCGGEIAATELLCQGCKEEIARETLLLEQDERRVAYRRVMACPRCNSARVDAGRRFTQCAVCGTVYKIDNSWRESLFGAEISQIDRLEWANFASGWPRNDVYRLNDPLCLYQTAVGL